MTIINPMAVATVVTSLGAKNTVDLIRSILDYRVKIANVVLEIERVREQAVLGHHKIDAELKKELIALQIGEKTVSKKFEMLHQSLESTIVSKKDLTKSMSDIVSEIINNSHDSVRVNALNTTLSLINDSLSMFSEEQIECIKNTR